MDYILKNDKYNFGLEVKVGRIDLYKEAWF